MIKKQAPQSREQIKSPNVVFGFSELRETSFTEARRDSVFFIDFIKHLRKFCQLSWDDIRTTQRHGLGTETIKADDLNSGAKAMVPSGLKKLLILRATGDNHAFLGYRDGNVFQVLFIEYAFGDIYNH